MNFNLALISVLILGTAVSGPALADACSGRDRGAGVLDGVFSHGKAAAGSVLLEGLAGNAVADDLDCPDRPYAARAYDRSFQGQVGRRYAWDRGPNHGYVVTNREYYREQRLCRDFTQVVYRHGREYDRSGTACRRPAGTWEFL